MSDLFSPVGGWRVRIMDLSGGAQDNITEEVGGFDTLMHANAFARRYVRDSVERCRVAGMSSKDVLEAWFAFGEDAIVVDAGEAGWKSATELGDSLRDSLQGRAGEDALMAAAQAVRTYVKEHPGRYAATVGATPSGPDDPLEVR